MSTIQMPHKPWSVAIFERERPHMTNFLKTRIIPLVDARECKRVVIRAPVKSGKREMAEYMAIRDHQTGGTQRAQRVHAFLSAWHRTADEMQRDELRQHELRVFPIRSRANALECVDWVEEKLAAGKVVVLHLDECDYGTGDRQSLRHIYDATHDNDRVFTILYSATPQEVLFSGEVAEDAYQGMIDDMLSEGVRVEYEPPAGYCGPARFLDAGLIREAYPFFKATGRETIELTAQGRTILADLRNGLAMGGRRNIVVLRLSYGEKSRGEGRASKDKKAIYQFLRGVATVPELADVNILVDKGEKGVSQGSGARHPRMNVRQIAWSNEAEWAMMQSSSPVIIVIDQTSSRSTEWACHDRIFATHDYRNKVTYSVVSQAQERVNHYEGRYGGFQPIRVYGHRKTFMLSAGRIDYSTYLRTEWEIRKIDHRRVRRDELGENEYELRSTAAGNALHPDYDFPLTKEEAETALLELGCAAEIDVSPRVRGGIREVHEYETEFFPCTRETFATAVRVEGHTFRGNPFDESIEHGLEGGRYKGHLRGWRVLDYERDIVHAPKWGGARCRRFICYRGDELGVAVSIKTDRIVRVDTLEAYRSMYCM